MPTPRTFKIQSPLMRGNDIKEWQLLLKEIASRWGVDLPIKTDGIYGLGTRSLSKTMLFATGFTHEQIDNGITPWLRTTMRNPQLRPEAVEDRKMQLARKAFRDDLREKFAKDAGSDVAAPISKITTMTWGYHPGVHDGIDLICGPNAPIYALCDAKVIDVRASGWWGNNPSGEVWRGDGIIQIECLIDQGPFKKGMHFGYGHAEGADVKVGQKVEAGARLGEAGLAVAWHVHLMANRGEFGLKGKGSMDPRPFVDYAIRHKP